MKSTFSLETPILRKIVQKIADPKNWIAKTIVATDKYVLGNRIAKTVVAVDQKINNYPRLRFIFSIDQELEFRKLRPFLHEELIQETMEFCLERERLNAQLPKPGGNWMQQTTIDGTNDLIASLAKKTTSIEPDIKEMLLRQLKNC